MDIIISLSFQSSEKKKERCKPIQFVSIFCSQELVICTSLLSHVVRSRCSVAVTLNVCMQPLRVLVICKKTFSGVQVNVLLHVEIEFFVAAYT